VQFTSMRTAWPGWGLGEGLGNRSQPLETDKPNGGRPCGRLDLDPALLPATVTGPLRGGQRQRLAIAALLPPGGPGAVLANEPLAQLDPRLGGGAAGPAAAPAVTGSRRPLLLACHRPLISR